MAISGSDWLEVPTIYKAYFSGLNFKEYHHKIWPYMVQYLQFRDPGIPIDYMMPQHEPSCEPKARRPWDFLRTKFCPKHGPISSLPWWPWGISKSFRPNVPWNPDVYSYPKKCANHLVNGNFRNRLIGGTYHIFLAYFSGLCKWISPENMALYGTVPPF